LKAHVSCKAGEMAEHMKHIHETVQKHIEDPTSEYNKLNVRKIGPCEVLERINDNAYRLKLPSHIKTPDIFFL